MLWYPAIADIKQHWFSHILIRKAEATFFDHKTSKKLQKIFRLAISITYRHFPASQNQNSTCSSVTGS